jgi:hypothetical protein
LTCAGEGFCPRPSRPQRSPCITGVSQITLALGVLSVAVVLCSGNWNLGIGALTTVLPLAVSGGLAWGAILFDQISLSTRCCRGNCCRGRPEACRGPCRRQPRGLAAGLIRFNLVSGISRYTVGIRDALEAIDGTTSRNFCSTGDIARRRHGRPGHQLFQALVRHLVSPVDHLL